MQWHDLLFMHWPIAVAAIRDYIPPALAIDSFDGSAWLGVAPFRMAGVVPRAIPPLPWLSAFAELNVRTYVTIEGKPGVWFFSLDAANPVAVEVARDLFHLNYYNASMRCTAQGDAISYASARRHRGAPPAEFVAQYRPTGPAYRSTPGTLEHFLTERYCLYAANRRGRVARGEIDHAPWPLQPAEAEIDRNTMTDQIRLELLNPPVLLHFARRLDVVGWAPQWVTPKAAARRAS
jgi:uncharacterized protein YqjF (DUF2071 family)